MTGNLSREMRAALDLMYALRMREIEVHQTRAGHWHPPVAPCLRDVCPMADSQTAARWSRVIARAAGFPEISPYAF